MSEKKKKEKNKLSTGQKVIIFMTIMMLTINSATMFIIKNLMQTTMIETEHKYLTEIVKNIENTTELTVFEYISICDILSRDSAFIELLQDSDLNNPMKEHENANIVVKEMSDIMNSYGSTIMSMAVFDIEQDSYLLNTGAVSGDDFSFKERPYYKAVETQKYIVTEPYLDVLTDGLIVTIGCPIIDGNGNSLGVVGLDLPIDFISHLVMESTYGDSGRSLVLDETSKIIAYSDPSYIDKDYTTLNLIGEELEKELLNPTGELVRYEMNGEIRLGMVGRIDALNWTVLTAMDYSEFDQISSFVIALMGISFLFSLVICVLLVSGKVSRELVDMHYRDTLTGLLNRAGFTTHMEKIVHDTPSSLGVISININGLKQINENSGVSVGDEHIKKSTKLLQDYFAYEFFRMSGDEFVGIAPYIEREVFEEKINSLHAAMKSTSNYDFSFGHAFGKSNDIMKLIQESETIMYINKQEYYSSQHKFNHVDNVILADLLSYLADDEFMVYLQPQVNLHDHSLYGAEALIRRFDKKNQKMVFPDQFIPLYEKNSIIRHIDMFVVETVCKLLKEWCELGKTVPVSVNLSRVTLQEYGIVDSIVKVCDKYNVPHKLLVIEVTERVGLVENNVASSLIQQFKDNGFHISLDDFGCAYSNIVTLAQIEVDEVKIDKSLVDDLITSRKNQVLVKNVLSMCNELENTSTLAEGIEDEEQANLLDTLGCQLGQGYFFSRPIPSSEFVEKYID